MGKTKTKYPVDITIQFCLLLTQNYLEKEVILKIHTPSLTYQNIRKPYSQFLEQYKINYPTVMTFSIQQDKQQITEDFQISIQTILDEFGGRFIIIVENYFQASIQKLFFEIDQIRLQIEEIRQMFHQYPTRQQLSLLRKNSLPILHHNQSNMPQITSYQQKQIDMGVLFSEPIFDQIKNKMAANPVDFRSQIQRLHTALKSSIKPDVTLKCQIATKQNLKHLIKYSKPKILHIICHGTELGELQFQDDSRTILGALQLLNGADIMNLLKGFQSELPELVFVNSCHSQRIGQAFYKLGVNYVIMIDSQDKIQDEAAQIFSEHFYRNIFNGEKVKQAFKQARQRVKMKHNYLGCCCRHSSKQVHKPDCRWKQMIKKASIYDQLELHKLFHVPPSDDSCKCQLKNLNRHKIDCPWAKQALFNINNDFRIPDGYGGFRFPKSGAELPKYLPEKQLVICCCFNYEGAPQETGQYRLPHSQSNKFKILWKDSSSVKQNIFDVVPRPFKQLTDYTAPQLVQTHQKIQSSIMGRQKQIYDFIKALKDFNQAIYILYGKVGVGRTSFALKCVTYLIQRKIFQIYFYIDLYGIKDKDIFRYKFNQITKFNYDGQIKISQVKNKSIIIILDNIDDFYESEKDQLYNQLRYLRQQLHKGKIIVSMKEENLMGFDLQKIHAETFLLPILAYSVATNVIFAKMRSQFQANVQFSDIDGLVRSNQSLRIPKIIESLCQSFSSRKNVKIAEIKKKLQDLAEGDSNGYNLIKENLQILQQKSQQSYQLLLFISQFSEGISIDDMKMLSLYDKKDSLVHLPITTNWQANFSNLFQKFKIQSGQKQPGEISSVITQQSESVPTPLLKNTLSIAPSIIQSENGKNNDKVIKGQSYFLDQVGENRFIVKRYIRDYIWKKHESQSNKYMKYIFIGYMTLMLQVYFKWLIQSKYIHQDLLQYSALSQTGLFSFKDNVFVLNVNLTQSVRIARQYNSQFQKIFSKSNAILQKIKRSDPSSFITNHKQDFLNIYEKSWDSVLKYLQQSKKNFSDKICIGYLENLMIFIPTAFKIAKVQTSLISYVISKSLSLLNKIQKYCEENKYERNQKILAIQLKLQLMKASIEIDKLDIQKIKQELDLNKGMTLGLVKSIKDDNFLTYLKKFWNFQKTYLLMYKEYISKNQISNKAFNDTAKSKISSQKIKTSIENLNIWLDQNWYESQQLLYAKRNLLIGLTYLSVLKSNINSVSTLANANTIKLKRQHEKTILKLIRDSIQIFKSRDLMKLCLKSKLTMIQIYALQIARKKTAKTAEKSQEKTLQFYQELTEKQKEIQDCQKMFTDRKNNLISFAQFEIQIKALKKSLKQTLWEQSTTTLVCMKPVPLTSNGTTPIIQNLSRKKNRFRKQIQKMVDPNIDLCSKFQILNRSKLRQQVQNGCTVLLLSANVKLINSKPFFIFQGPRMQQDSVQINKQFIQEYQMSKIKILIIAGKNSFIAIQRLSKLMNDPPFMISLGNVQKQEQVNQFKQFQQNFSLTQNNYLLKIQQRRRAQVAFLKQFVRRLMKTQINSKQQVIQICQACQQVSKDVIEMRIQCSKRISPLLIHHKKGSYKDLSPGYQKNHNVDMKVKSNDNSNFIALRRWIQTFRVFEYIQRKLEAAKEQDKPRQPAYINIFGDIGSGKSSFVQQVARIFVQRQKFSSGVYIIDGKVVQKNYQGDFQNYFIKQSQIGKIMTLEDFEKNGNQNLMLIIDDFHFIKPRSNGRFNLFLQKIADKKINLIIVTNNIYQKQGAKQNKKDSIFALKRIKPIGIEKLCPLQIDLIAYSTFDLTNKKLLQKYEQIKHRNHGDITVKDLAQLKSSFYGKKNKQHEFLYYESKQMKKQQSNQV